MWFDFHLKAIILHLQAMVRFIYTLSDSTKSCSIYIYIDTCIIIWKLLPEMNDHCEYEKETWSVVHMF